MSILRTLGRMAIQRLANDPKLQKRLKHVVADDVIPKVQKGVKKMKPKLRKIRKSGVAAIRKVREKIEK